MYWTGTAGTGGRVEREEDFAVEEIPLKKFFAKYTRSKSGVTTVKGPYTLALLRKKGMTTLQAIKFLQEKFNINKDDIGYAGLKDKFAVTTQYVTIRGNVSVFETEKISLSCVGSTDKMMQIGELEGNKFTIKLSKCKHPENAKRTVTELQVMPNYFGSQRFGIDGDNHMIGRMLLQGKQTEAIAAIRSKHVHPTKKMLKFFIHAYQSYIFNSLLDKCIEKNQKPGKIPIVGYDTKLGNDFAGKEAKKLMENDSITPKSFAIRELDIKCNGSTRDAFVTPEKISCSVNKNTIVVQFELPKGSYATVFIREITKQETVDAAA